MVSFFTRDQGKLRGVAKRARRPKSAFGAGLERSLASADGVFPARDQGAGEPGFLRVDSLPVRVGFRLPDGQWRWIIWPKSAISCCRRPSRARSFSGCWWRFWTICGGGAAWRAVTVLFSCGRCGSRAGCRSLHVCLGCGSLLDDPEAPERAFFSRGRDRVVVRPLPAHFGSGRSWGVERGIAGDGGGNVADAGGAACSRASGSGQSAADLRRFLVRADRVAHRAAAGDRARCSRKLLKAWNRFKRSSSS